MKKDRQDLPIIAPESAGQTAENHQPLKYLSVKEAKAKAHLYQQVAESIADQHDTDPQNMSDEEIINRVVRLSEIKNAIDNDTESALNTWDLNKDFPDEAITQALTENYFPQRNSLMRAVSTEARKYREYYEKLNDEISQNSIEDDNRRPTLAANLAVLALGLSVATSGVAENGADHNIQTGGDKHDESRIFELDFPYEKNMLFEVDLGIASFKDQRLNEPESTAPQTGGGEEDPADKRTFPVIELERSNEIELSEEIMAQIPEGVVSAENVPAELYMELAANQNYRFYIEAARNGADFAKLQDPATEINVVLIKRNGKLYASGYLTQIDTDGRNIVTLLDESFIATPYPFTIDPITTDVFPMYDPQSGELIMGYKVGEHVYTIGIEGDEVAPSGIKISELPENVQFTKAESIFNVPFVLTNATDREATIVDEPSVTKKGELITGEEIPVANYIQFPGSTSERRFHIVIKDSQLWYVYGGNAASGRRSLSVYPKNNGVVEATPVPGAEDLVTNVETREYRAEDFRFEEREGQLYLTDLVTGETSYVESNMVLENPIILDNNGSVNLRAGLNHQIRIRSDNNPLMFVNTGYLIKIDTESLTITPSNGVPKTIQYPSLVILVPNEDYSNQSIYRIPLITTLPNNDNVVDKIAITDGRVAQDMSASIAITKLNEIKFRIVSVAYSTDNFCEGKNSEFCLTYNEAIQLSQKETNYLYPGKVVTIQKEY